MTSNSLFAKMYRLLIAASLTGFIDVVLLMIMIITGTHLLPIIVIGIIAFAILWTMFQHTGDEAYAEETRRLLQTNS